MTPEDLLQRLRDLEVALHQPHVRADGERLDALLHNAFVECGRSGRRYDKAGILNALPRKEQTEAIWSQDFSLAEIGEGVALLTYRSARLDGKGDLSRHTLRASLWQRTARGWRMRFHQGTPTAPFTRNEA